MARKPPELTRSDLKETRTLTDREGRVIAEAVREGGPRGTTIFLYLNGHSDPVDGFGCWEDARDFAFDWLRRRPKITSPKPNPHEPHPDSKCAALYFTPDAIRSAFDGWDCSKAVDKLTDDELAAVGDSLLESDRIYEAYREEMEGILEEDYDIKIDETRKTGFKLFDSMKTMEAAATFRAINTKEKP